MARSGKIESIMQNYQKTSQNIKNKAQDFLTKFKVLENLSKYGQPQIYGSFALDLMYRNDLDIALLVDQIDYAIVLKLQEELVQKGFNHFWIFDNRKGGWPEDPKHIVCDAYFGYYDQTVKLEDKWEIGITICNEEELQKVLKVTKQVSQAIENNPDKKDLILRLKFELGDKDGERSYPSRKIYEAVIGGNVKSVEEFEKYIKESPAV